MKAEYTPTARSLELAREEERMAMAQIELEERAEMAIEKQIKREEER